MIVVIDNEDSFTYNIVYALKSLGEQVEVVSTLGDLKPDALIIGPGPGHPDVHSFKLLDIPTLGICLGHQWLGLNFGSTISRFTPYHGKSSKIYHTSSHLFTGLPQAFKAVRYHSLIIEKLSDCFIKTAWTHDGQIMGIAHKTLPYYGVQFHPDSISTEFGTTIFKNFVNQI